MATKQSQILACVSVSVYSSHIVQSIRVQTEKTKFSIKNIRIAQNTTSCVIEDADKPKERTRKTTQKIFINK